MSSETPADADYPYAYKPPAILRPADFSSSPAQRSAGRFIWVWFQRLAFAAGVIVAMMALPIGIVGYRAARQARLVDELQSRGCQVKYEFVSSDEPIQSWLEETFGKSSFAEVEEVSAMFLSNPNDPRAICNICRHFDRLQSFEIASDSFSFREMANWKQLDQLVVLNLQSSTITDDDLARIGRMPKLLTLHVRSPRITDKGLNNLAGLTKLGIMTIDSAQLEGTGPANAKGFPELGTLEILNSPRLGDQVVINLGPLPELLSLNLVGTQIGDAAIAHAASGGKLTRISEGYANHGRGLGIAREMCRPVHRGLGRHATFG